MSAHGSEKSHVSVGPYGGRSGVPWDDGIYGGVKKITITHGALIDSIQIEYDTGGKSVLSERHGSYGYKTDKIHFDLPNECITCVTGHYGNLDEYGPVYVRSIAFESNKRRYGPFGIPLEIPFSIPLTGSSVVGFHGRSSFHLDSIGVHLRPLLPRNLPLKPETNTIGGVQPRPPPPPRLWPGMVRNVIKVDPFYSLTGNIGKTEIKEMEPLKMKPVASLGPWGGVGGTPFDDGPHSAVYIIHLARSSVGVVSIQACYDRNGRIVWGNTNGGIGGNRLDKITFDHPHEHLTRISGFYGPSTFGGPTVVKSITFYTNGTKYGPFGEEKGTHFSSDLKEGGSITGFHGTKGNLLESIGVYVV